MPAVSYHKQRRQINTNLIQFKILYLLYIETFFSYMIKSKDNKRGYLSCHFTTFEIPLKNFITIIRFSQNSRILYTQLILHSQIFLQDLCMQGNVRLNYDLFFQYKFLIPYSLLLQELPEQFLQI